MVCSKCHEPVDAYYPGRKWCRPCYNEYFRNYYQSNTNKAKNYTLRWQQNNRERYNKIAREGYKRRKAITEGVS